MILHTPTRHVVMVVTALVVGLTRQPHQPGSDADTSRFRSDNYLVKNVFLQHRSVTFDMLITEAL